MNEKRSVDCGGEVIDYTLVRKKVKNINMRVKADGSVSVSAPNRVSAKLSMILCSRDMISSKIPSKDYPRSEGTVLPSMMIRKHTKTVIK